MVSEEQREYAEVLDYQRIAENNHIMLNELDKELERRGHKFVRYADDCIIFCKSKRSAERTVEHIIPYIEKKLFLRVSRTKTTVSHVSKIKYLGYGFY